MPSIPVEDDLLLWCGGPRPTPWASLCTGPPPLPDGVVVMHRLLMLRQWWTCSLCCLICVKYLSHFLSFRIESCCHSDNVSLPRAVIFSSQRAHVSLLTALIMEILLKESTMCLSWLAHLCVCVFHTIVKSLLPSYSSLCVSLALWQA